MNKNIFITGGTSGIGKSLILEFAKKKYNIFFTYYKNSKKARSILKELEKFNGHYSCVRMDLNRIISITNAFKIFYKKYKKLDIFINNASTEIERKLFLKLKNKDIYKKINGLLVGNIVSLKSALELVLKNKTKSIIINISSYAAISGGKNIHLYAASKSALNTLVIALSKDPFTKNVKIVSLVPRRIDTPTFRKNNKIKNNFDLTVFKKRNNIKNVKTSKEFASFIHKKVIKQNILRYNPIVYFDSV
jgi:3-oxoacyl-[acyl-carrier protein] reductase